MSPDRVSSVGSRERKVAAFADEIRADVATAFFFGAGDGTDSTVLRRLRESAVELHACVDRRPRNEIADIFDADVGPRTPLLGVALVFNDQRHGLMLLSDDNSVGVSYRMVAPDTDHESAARDLARHVIFDDEVVPLSHGVCDSISAGLAMPHTFFIVYAVDVTLVEPSGIRGTLVKASDLDETKLDPLTRFMIGGASRDVLDSPFALTADTRAVIGQVRERAHDAAVAAKDRSVGERFGHVARTAELILEGVDGTAPLMTGDFAHLGARTPLVGAEGIILDHEERMLLWRRKGDSQWSMPGGRCEVGESSAATVVREIADNLEIEVEIGGLAGVFDNRLLGAADAGYDVCFVYAGRVLRTAGPVGDDEEAEVRWCPLPELDAVELVNGQREKIGAALQALSG